MLALRAPCEPAFRTSPARRCPHLPDHATPWAALALSLLALAGCQSPFDRRAMLNEIGTGVIFPAHEALSLEASRLDSAAVAFVAAPTEGALGVLRDRWLSAELAWRGVHLFQFDGLLILHNEIEKRPARADFIEQTIAARAERTGPTVDSDFIEGVGATSKGLGAIEYLLFPGGGEAAAMQAFRSPARGEYLLALTANLVSKSGELLSYWAPEGGNHLATFIESESAGADIQGSISRLSNRMIELHEVATRDWLGRPTGRTTDGIARAKDVEAPLSGRSLDLLIASVESAQRTFQAGLDDYVEYLDPEEGPEGLSQRISGQFNVALAALRGIDEPLEEAVIDTPERTGAAYDEMRELVPLLKSEMAGRLGVTVTFSDADGD